MQTVADMSCKTDPPRKGKPTPFCSSRREKDRARHACLRFDNTSQSSHYSELLLNSRTLLLILGPKEREKGREREAKKRNPFLHFEANCSKGYDPIRRKIKKTKADQRNGMRGQFNSPRWGRSPNTLMEQST